jgi:hypothetical protein
MPGETSKRIGDLGEELKDDFLDKLGWEFVRGSFDIDYETDKVLTKKGDPKKKHGIDGVYKYYDHYLRKTVYVIISAKAISWKQKSDKPQLKTIVSKLIESKTFNECKNLD